MRFNEFRVHRAAALTEAAKVGREYQHLEDLVFIEGAKGAFEAADIIDNLGSDAGDVAIKWDGNPTIYWGRDENGEFVMVGKNGWGKNKSTSPEDLANFIKNTGKGEEWREAFGNNMAAIFPILEQATPTEFRGYVFGDLLYYPGRPFTTENGRISFTPNLVKYTVDPDSKLGQRIANSEVGVVAHSKYDEFGSKSGTPVSDVKELNSNDAVVLGQTYVTHQPEVDTQETNKIRDFANKHARAIDEFLAPRKGLSDMKQIIYTYVNQMSRSQQLAKLESGFFNWLKGSRVSANKQAKIAQLAEEMPTALPAIFKLVKMIMTVKDHIIDQLDSAEADVTASTRGEPGGEGYVAQNSKVKLVPRARWQPN